MTNSNTLQPSLSSLVQLRSEGRCRSDVFLNRVREKRSKKILSRTQRIHSPDKSIRSLDVHPVDSHFLLAGSREGIVSVYDLSEYGAEKRPDGSRGGVRIHKPIARSVASPEENGETIRLGSAISTRWYPADSGAFISAHAAGSLTIWDTNTMSLAARLVPYASEVQREEDGVATSLLSTMEISPFCHDQVAVGSSKFPTVRLVDIRSGACSHTLTGHRRGVSRVQWSPTCEHILASGCVDGCIRLWDVRKPGRNGWIMDCLDQDFQPKSLLKAKEYRPDYSHLQRHMEIRNRVVGSGLKKKKKTKRAGPNDYQSAATRQGSQSHEGSIAALEFDPSGHFLVSNGTEGMMKLWDLRGEGHLVPRRFTRTAPTTQLQVVNDGGCIGGGTRASSSSSSSRVLPSSFLPATTTIWSTYGSTLRAYALQEGGAPRQELLGHLKTILAMKYIADTGEIVSGGADGVIVVWTPKSIAQTPDIATGQDRKRKRAVDQDSW